MYIGICDDEPENLEEIAALIQKQNCLISMEIVKFSTMQQLCQHTQKLDVLFLDIEVGQENSLEYLLADKLPYIPIIVLVSAHPCYVTPSYHAAIFQFLLKPLQPALFAKVFAACCQRFQQLQQCCALKDAQGETCYILLRHIVFIKSERRRVVYCDHNQKQYFSTEQSLQTALERLQHFGFCQIHKSYLVNLAYVDEIKKNCLAVQMTKKMMELSVGKKYLQTVQQRFLDYLAVPEED